MISKLLRSFELYYEFLGAEQALNSRSLTGTTEQTESLLGANSNTTWRPGPAVPGNSGNSELRRVTIMSVVLGQWSP